MSNPTTPFGWQMPTNTDLVTDLPADFEVFGQAVATSMQDLLGGTTGQVLAKASNTDMDFVWSADAAGMTNPMTTTGDSIYSSSGSTPARLGIGTTGQVLTVAGGLPSWATPASAGGMTLLSTTSLSGSSITISSIPGTYRNLQLIIVNFKPSSDGAGFNYRYNGDSSAKYADTGTNATDSNPNQTSTNFAPAADSGVSQGFSILDVYDYANAVTWKTSYGMSFTNNPTNTSNFNTYSHAGIYASTSAINSITLLVSSGNFTSGTAYLYGVK